MTEYGVSADRVVGAAVPRSLLPEAVWWVDAGSVDGDRLTDLSGNGRDAVFGAGASAPLVLDHDGTDYIWFPDPALYGVYQRVQTSAVLPEGEIKIEAKFRLGPTGVGLILMYGQTVARGVIRSAVNPNGQLVVAYFTGVDTQVDQVLWTGLGTFDDGAWHDVTITYSSDGAGASVTLDGIDRGYQAFAAPRPLAIPNAGYYVGYNGQLARMTVKQGSTVLLDLDPANVSTDYQSIPDAGTLPVNDWLIYRAPDDTFRLAVVDRPLLLFGNGQHLDATSALPGSDARTIVAAIRTHLSQTVGVLVETRLSGGGSGGNTTATTMYQSGGAVIRAGMVNAAGGFININHGSVVPNVTPVFARFINVDASTNRMEVGVAGGTVTSTTLTADPAAPAPVGGGQLRVGKNISLGEAWVGELVALAIFDRALTDTEIRNVTAELLGQPLSVDSGPWTAELSAYPYSVTRQGGQLTQRSVLSDAVWHVDAAHAESDRLTDLSGNGRDAVFGAGDAAPKVLPHDGEDYIHCPLNQGQRNDLYLPSLSGAVGGTAVVTIHAKDYEPQSGIQSGLFTLGARTYGHWSVARKSDGGFNSRVFDATNTGLTQGNNVQFDTEAEWHRFTKSGVTCTYETSSDGSAWTVVGTWTHDAGFDAVSIGPTARVNYADGLVLGGGWTIYSATFVVDGVTVVDLNPANVSADYATISNPGTEGGDWTITRADSGYKTAVVDRPLLLFGGRSDLGASFKTAGSPDNAMTVGTLIAARRRFASANAVRGVSMAETATGTEGGAYEYMDTPGGNLVIAHYAPQLARLYTPNVGQQTVAWRNDGTTLSTALNGSWGTTHTRTTQAIAGNAYGYGFSNYHIEEEFIGMALFDRALSDAEIARATDELLGVWEPLVFDGGAKTAQLLRRRVEPAPLLPSAAWWVDAGSLTEDEDGLADLSGQGRDALFGAGAAAPVVLPHDGEDYFWFGVTRNNNNRVSREGIVTTADPITVEARVWIPSGAASELAVFETGNVPFAMNTRVLGSGKVRVGLNGETTEDYTVIDTVASVPFDQWTEIKVVQVGDTATVTIEGVDEVLTGYPTPRQDMTRSATYRAGSSTHRQAWVKVTANGDSTPTWDVRASQVNADYTQVADLGTAGGVWDIGRHTTGYQTAVVDRDLILFGGAQDMKATADFTWGSQWTILVGLRTFGTLNNITDARNTVGPSSRHTGLPAIYHNSADRPYVSHYSGTSFQALGVPAALAGQKVVALRRSGTTWTISDPTGSNSATYADYPDNTDGGFTIGRRYDSPGSNAMRGEFIGAAIFDRALTDDEVARVGLELLGTPRVVDAGRKSARLLS